MMKSSSRVVNQKDRSNEYSLDDIFRSHQGALGHSPQGQKEVVCVEEAEVLFPVLLGEARFPAS